MKFAFVTCVSLGFGCLKEIYKCGGKIDLLITLQDEIAKKKSGRIYLDSFAKKKEIILHKCKNINENKIIKLIIRHQIKYLFVIGWSQILKQLILMIPNIEIIGMHPTLLPKGRGRASIPWSILKNLKYTGVTAFKIDKNVDTGPLIANYKIKILKKDNATTLYKKIEKAHIILMHNLWKKIKSNELVYYKQLESEATYWRQRTPSDGRVYNYMNISKVKTMFRALMPPYPGIFLIIKKEKISILEIQFKKKLSDKKFYIVDRKIFFKLKDGSLIITKWKKIAIS